MMKCLILKKKVSLKNITKQVLNLKKKNKDRTKILNSYRKWLKNNNTAKSVQMGGARDIYDNIVTNLNNLKTDAGDFTNKIDDLIKTFDNPITDPYKNANLNPMIEDLITANPSGPTADNNIIKLFQLFNEENLLGKIIQNYYAIFNFAPLTDIVKDKFYSGTTGSKYINKNNNFNDVIFSKIATGTLYEQKPNESAKGFYSDWNVSAPPPQKPTSTPTPVAPTVIPSPTGTAPGTIPAPGTGTGTGTAPSQQPGLRHAAQPYNPSSAPTQQTGLQKASLPYNPSSVLVAQTRAAIAPSSATVASTATGTTALFRIFLEIWYWDIS